MTKVNPKCAKRPQSAREAAQSDPKSTPGRSTFRSPGVTGPLWILLLAAVACIFSLFSPTKPAPIRIKPAIRRLYAQTYPKVVPKSPSYAKSGTKVTSNLRQIHPIAL